MRLPEPFVFFLDRSLGANVVANALRAANEQVIVHGDHFAHDTDDEVWLTEAGRRGWVVLTKDAAIRSNELERNALLVSGVAAFMLGRGDLGGSEMAGAFVASLPRMKKALRRFEVPFIARVTVAGEVTILYDGSGRLQPPKRIK